MATHRRDLLLARSRSQLHVLHPGRCIRTAEPEARGQAASGVIGLREEQ